MSSRQARRERREAERKQKKAEMKRVKTETQLGQTILSAAIGFVSQSEPNPDPKSGFVSHNT